MDFSALSFGRGDFCDTEVLCCFFGVSRHGRPHEASHSSLGASGSFISLQDLSTSLN